MCCEKCGRENPDDKSFDCCERRQGFDIAQAFAPGELGEGQTEKLIPAGEALHFVIATVTFHAATEFHQRKENPSPEQKSFRPLFMQHSPRSFAVAVE